MHKITLRFLSSSLLFLCILLSLLSSLLCFILRFLCSCFFCSDLLFCLWLSWLSNFLNNLLNFFLLFNYFFLHRLRLFSLFHWLRLIDSSTWHFTHRVINRITHCTFSLIYCILNTRIFLLILCSIVWALLFRSFSIHFRNNFLCSNRLFIGCQSYIYRGLHPLRWRIFLFNLLCYFFYIFDRRWLLWNIRFLNIFSNIQWDYWVLILVLWLSICSTTRSHYEFNLILSWSWIILYIKLLFKIKCTPYWYNRLRITVFMHIWLYVFKI